MVLLPDGAKMDINSLIDAIQVQEIYILLEKRFAEAAEGEVKLQYKELIPNSVFAEVIFPELERNEKIKLCMS